MTLPAGARKLVLAVHVAVSVGWMGAVAGYLALDVAAARSRHTPTLRAAYLGMDVIAGNVIVPLALAALGSGIVISLGTKWGLVRHYWVVFSLALTTAAVAVLLIETQTIADLARTAADPATTDSQLRALGSTLAHSVGGTVVLLVILALNVFKPKGMTRYGWRMQQQERASRR